MIALASHYLLFRLANGESRPLCADTAATDLLDVTATQLEPEFLAHAAHAIFHYFKHELRRESVTVGEFAAAMEKVLRGFARGVQQAAAARQTVGADLACLARESREGGELFFFPRLREEFRRQVRRSPSLVRFRGLRAASKQLAGARRWSPRCQAHHDRIVEFLRSCMNADAPDCGTALLVQ